MFQKKKKFEQSFILEGKKKNRIFQTIILQKYTFLINIDIDTCHNFKQFDE